MRSHVRCAGVLLAVVGVGQISGQPASLGSTPDGVVTMTATDVMFALRRAGNTNPAVSISTTVSLVAANSAQVVSLQNQLQSTITSLTGNIALKANQSNVTALSNQLSTNRIGDQSTVEAVRSTLTMQISQVRSLAIRGPLPTCTAFSQPTTARWTAACTGGACTVTCRTPYTGTATTINCTSGGWVGMFPRCGQTYSFGAGTTNLATLRSGQSTCGDGQSFKVAHIAGRNEIILADSIANSCLFSGDDLLLLSPTSGHFGVVNVFQITSDGFGVVTSAPIPPAALSGNDFFVTRIAQYSSLQIPAGATVTTTPFDSARGVGGVIAIRATSVLLRGMINASMLGFPGGSPGSPPMGVVSPVIGGGGGGGASGHGCVAQNNVSLVLGPQNAPGHGADGSLPGGIVQGFGGNGGSGLNGGGGGGAGYGFNFGTGGTALGGGGNGGSKSNNVGQVGSAGSAAGCGGGGGASGRDAAGGGGGARSVSFDVTSYPSSSASRLLFGFGGASGAGGGGGGGAGDFQCAVGGSGGFSSGNGGAAGGSRCTDPAAVATAGQNGQPGAPGGGAVVVVAGTLTVSGGSIIARGGPGGAGGAGGLGAADTTVCLSNPPATRRRSEGGGGGGGGFLSSVQEGDASAGPATPLADFASPNLDSLLGTPMAAGQFTYPEPHIGGGAARGGSSLATMSMAAMDEDIIDQVMATGGHGPEVGADPAGGGGFILPEAPAQAADAMDEEFLSNLDLDF
eukprot:m.162146 g.162146  ORF g.162146 m.162146 type:complete len:739 (+) comp14596_c0_seq5:28-2244(+)